MTLLLGASVVAGCSPDGTGSSNTNVKAEKKATEQPTGPVKISMMIPF